MKMSKICSEIPNARCYDLFNESVVSSVPPIGKVWIYFLCDSDLNVRYVGKTSSLAVRASRHRHPKAKTYRDNWLKKMIRENRSVIMAFVEQCSQNDWIERERFWIKFAKEQNWEITNLTDGGEGSPGHKYIMTEEHKRAISDAKKGNVIISEQQKETLRQHNLGKKHTESAKRLISLHHGRVGNPGSKTWVGRKHSEESKQKMSDAAKRRPRRKHSEETKRKMSNAAKSRPTRKCSEETKRKLRDAAKANWKMRKSLDKSEFDGIVGAWTKICEFEFRR